MKVLWKSALLLCCAGPGRTQRSSSGESLVPHLQGADCQPGGGLTVRGLNVRKGSDEGILCDWNQRSESGPILSECAREDGGTEYLKS